MSLHLVLAILGAAGPFSILIGLMYWAGSARYSEIEHKAEVTRLVTRDELEARRRHPSGGRPA